MNGLVQLESTLIGTKEAVEKLKKVSSATLLVISDSHGDTETVEQIIQNFGADSDALLFCGDGFSDIMAVVEKAFTNEKLQARLPPIIACVQGNGDPPSQIIAIPNTGLCKYLVKRSLTFTVAGRIVFLTHGNTHCVDLGVEMLSSVAYLADADLAFYGHTHQYSRDDIGGTFYLNPGSCSRPRGRQVPSFAVVSFPGKNERYDAEFFCINKNMFKNCEFTSLDLI